VELDPFLVSQRRRARFVFVIVVAVLTATAGLLFERQGANRKSDRRLVAQVEDLLLQADPGSLAAASGLLAGIEAPGAEFLALGARTQLLRYRHGTARRTELQQARSLLDAIPVERKDDPGVLFARAWEATLSGRLKEGSALREALGPHGAGPERWRRGLQALDAELASRRGEACGPTGAHPLGALTAAAIAWEEGRWPDAEVAFRAAGPAGVEGRNISAARAAPLGERTAALQALVEGGGMSPVGLARAAVTLAAWTEAQQGAESAVSLLGAALQADPSAPTVAAALSRLHARMGQFTLARTTALNALQDHPGNEDLLAAWAEASWALDDPHQIREQVRRIDRAAEPGWGVTMAVALAELLEGQAKGARFPDGRRGAVWRCHSALEAGDGAASLSLCGGLAEELERAADGSPLAVQSARLRQIHALALSGRKDAPRQLAEVVRAGARSPFTSWLRGRAEMVMGRTKEARGALLDGCFRGQDFALGCLELVQVYQRAAANDVTPETLREAALRYTRISPRGAHIEAARAVPAAEE
jgi:hypothetical protein